VSLHQMNGKSPDAPARLSCETTWGNDKPWNMENQINLCCWSAAAQLTARTRRLHEVRSRARFQTASYLYHMTDHAYANRTDLDMQSSPAQVLFKYLRDTGTCTRHTTSTRKHLTRTCRNSPAQGANTKATDLDLRRQPSPWSKRE
jgi:hypothetical protein